MTHATFVVSTVLTLGAALAAPLIQAVRGGRDAEPAVRALSAQEVDAFLRRDRERLASLWSEDFVVTNPLNRLARKTDVLAMIDSGFLVITEYERRIEYARAEKDLVIFAGSETVKWGGAMPGAGTPQQLRFTAIWKKLPDGWQQIVRHANVMNPSTASKWWKARRVRDRDGQENRGLASFPLHFLRGDTKKHGVCAQECAQNGVPKRTVTTTR